MWSSQNSLCQPAVVRVSSVRSCPRSVAAVLTRSRARSSGGPLRFQVAAATREPATTACHAQPGATAEAPGAPAPDEQRCIASPSPVEIRRSSNWSGVRERGFGTVSRSVQIATTMASAARSQATTFSAHGEHACAAGRTRMVAATAAAAEQRRDVLSFRGSALAGVVMDSGGVGFSILGLEKALFGTWARYSKEEPKRNPSPELRAILRPGFRKTFPESLAGTTIGSARSKSRRPQPRRS